MTITGKSWDEYIKQLRVVSDTAAGLMAKMLKKVRESDPDLTTVASRYALIDYAYGLAIKYGEAAAELACEMYDEMAVLSAVMVPPAVPAESATMAEVAKAVNGTLKTRNDEIVSGAVGRLVKLSSVDTVMNNALRDGAQWAWIPRGDTCAYCIMLASNGWQNASKRAIRNGHAEHVHSNCDCTYAVRFDEDTDVEGYDPDKYYDMYKYGEGIDDEIWDESIEKYGSGASGSLNAMRRQFYHDNKAEINAQKRDAYAKRKEREASSAEELNIE